jgi:hypothetical protein
MLLNLNNITSLTQFNQLFAQVFGQQLKGITMSYNHRSTVDAQKILSHSDLVSAATQAKELDYAHFLDGVPCVKETKEFAEELLKLNPTLKFAPTGNRDVTMITDVDGQKRLVKYHRFYVYMDDSPYMLGEIGYGDYSVRGSGADTFMVKSRKINNAKFSEWREQQNMIMAKDMKKAVKTALKYLMPYTTKDIAEVSFNKFSNEVTNASDKAKSNLYRELRDLGGSVLCEELRHLLKQGASFKTKEFQNFAVRADELFGELDDESKRDVNAQFVYVYDGGGSMYADVINTLDPRNEHRLSTKKIVQTHTYRMEELPSDIVEKVSVLNILTDDQYVARVGLRVSANTFWIERG